jgi:hypothetical protein
MQKDSRKTIYAGVNFVFAPTPNLGMENRLEFQRMSEEIGIQLTEFRLEGNRFISLRRTSMPIEVLIGVTAPQIGQIRIVAPEMGARSLGGFASEADDIVEIFSRIWPAHQIIACDATIRDLYDASGQHAFQELWEGRLHQPQNSIGALNRPVLGGGLRLVMPPTSEDPSDPLVELKIESYLKDTKKFFIEAQFQWQRPQPPGAKLDPENRLITVDNFIQNETLNFIMEA